MKPEKKLKRGLPDISPLFAGMPLSVLDTSERLAPRVDEAAAPAAVLGYPKFICSSFISFTDQFNLPDLIRLINAFQPSFDQLFYMALDPTKARYEALASIFTIPTYEEVAKQSDIFLQTTDDVTFTYVPAAQCVELIHPQLASQTFLDCDTQRRSLGIIDGDCARSSVSSTALERELFYLLDHCILVVEAKASRLTEAYEWLRNSYAQNPNFRCSLLLVGKEAKLLWEFVYERFNALVSEFLIHDLGFLGWLDQDNMRLNVDYLLGEAQGTAQISTKKRLSDAIYRASFPDDYIRIL